MRYPAHETVLNMFENGLKTYWIFLKVEFCGSDWEGPEFPLVATNSEYGNGAVGNDESLMALKASGS